MSRRGRWLLSVGVLSALIAVVVVVLGLSRHPGGSAAAPHAETSAGSVAVHPSVADGVVVHDGSEPGERVTVDEATRLLSGIPAAIAAGQSDWLAADSSAKPADVRSLLPANSTLSVDGASWRRTGAVASVDAVVNVPAAHRLRVVLVRQPDGWRVSETLPEGTP